MDCNRCSYRDEDSRIVSEFYEKIQVLAMNGLIRGDIEFVKHILWEIENLHREIKRHLLKREKEDGPKNLSI